MLFPESPLDASQLEHFQNNKQGKQRMLQNNHNFTLPPNIVHLFFYFIGKNRNHIEWRISSYAEMKAGWHLGALAYYVSEILKEQLRLFKCIFSI